MTLDKSALFAAMEAFWETEGGNDRGIEAAISAYLQRLGLAPFNDMATRKRAALAAITARSHVAAPSKARPCYTPNIGNHQESVKMLTK